MFLTQPVAGAPDIGIRPSRRDVCKLVDTDPAEADTARLDQRPLTQRDREGGRQHKASADPLNHCTSLDLPLDVEDSGSTTMGEQQEDPAAAADLQASEDDLFAEQLHDAIEEALAKLSDHEAAVIRRRYYQRQTWAEIEEDSGIKTSQGRTTEHSALTKLRRNPVLNRFHEEVITYHSYTGTGFAAWKHGGSVEECLIEYLDAKGAYLYGGAVNAAVQQKEST